MAAPHVAGGVALLWQAKPALKGNVDQTESNLDHCRNPPDLGCRPSDIAAVRLSSRTTPSAGDCSTC